MSCPLSFPGSGPLYAFHPPEPLHPLLINSPALLPQQAVGHPPSPADVLSRDLPEAMAELLLQDRDDLAVMALRAAVLPHHPANKAFRSPVMLLQKHDGLATTFRAQNFPSARSCSIAFSSWVSRQAPSACMQPHYCRLRVRGLPLCDKLESSTTVLPWAISSSAVLSLRMIRSPVRLLRFMVGSPAQSGPMRTLIHPGVILRGHVRFSDRGNLLSILSKNIHAEGSPWLILHTE